MHYSEYSSRLEEGSVSRLQSLIRYVYTDIMKTPQDSIPTRWCPCVIGFELEDPGAEIWNEEGIKYSDHGPIMLIDAIERLFMISSRHMDTKEEQRPA